MTFSLPAGLEAWRLCPMSGCFVNVYGRVTSANYCREHGGDPAFETADDEYGLPHTGSGGSPPPPEPRLTRHAAYEVTEP